MLGRWDLDRDRQAMIDECTLSGLDLEEFEYVYPEEDSDLVNKYNGILILQLGAVMAPLINEFGKKSK